MWGTIVNVGAILLGTLIGCAMNKNIPEKIHKVVMQGLGLSVLVIGFMGAIKTDMALLLIVSLALGGGLGSWLAIERRLDNLGQKIQDKFNKENEDSKIAEGFVTATLIYCVGAMAILGSLDSGLSGNHDTLYIKSLLDGIASIVLASTLGWGVALSIIPVFLYQGSITLCAGLIAPLLNDTIMNELSAVGGVLILGIGINLLKIKKIHVGDLLPAVFIPVIYYLIIGLF